MFYTDRLMLRPIDPEIDIAFFLRFRSDVDILWAMTLEGPKPMVRSEVKSMVERMAAPSDNLPCFMVCEKPAAKPDQLAGNDDPFIEDGKSRYPAFGILHFHAARMSYINRWSSIGIAFDKQHQGLGYGTEVLNWTLEYAFNTLGLHKLKLSVAAGNERAWKCYEKVGFKYEGRLREEYFKDGKWEDKLLMAVLREEWRARKRETVAL